MMQSYKLQVLPAHCMGLKVLKLGEFHNKY